MIHPDETLPRIKFADEHRDAILRGDKTATVRIGDAGEGLDPGDPFVVTDPDGDPWAVVTTRSVVECMVSDVPLSLDAMLASYPHDHPAEVAVALERHYDRRVDLDDEVRIVIWGPPHV